MTMPIAIVPSPAAQLGSAREAPPQAHHIPPPGPAAPAAALSSRIVVRRAAVATTVVGVLAGLLLAYEFWLSSIPEARAQAELLAAFKQAVPTTTLDQPSSAPAEGGPVALLRIPHLGMTQVVIEGSSPSDLKQGPAHLSASPLPGEYGDAVIEGRRTSYGAPFAKLDSLRRGDAIKVTTGQGQFTYTVSKVEHVSAGQPDVVGTTKDSRLTLVTSDPAFIATGRLAVVAKLNGKPLAVATRPAVLEGPGDLGLAGDPLGLALGLIWLILLCAAGFVAWRLRRRLPRSVLYLFTAPVVTALALLMFANLDSLLPGTM